MNLTQARNALKETDRETLEGLIERFGENLVAHYQEEGYSLGNMEDSYHGEYRSDEDFAREEADDEGLVDKDLSWPMYCIDWAYAARELMQDYFEIDGHYFRC